MRQLFIHGIWTITHARRYVTWWIFAVFTRRILAKQSIRDQSRLQPPLSVSSSRRGFTMGHAGRIWCDQPGLLTDLASVLPYFSSILTCVTIILALVPYILTHFASIRRSCISHIALLPCIASVDPNLAHGWRHLTSV